MTPEGRLYQKVKRYLDDRQKRKELWWFKVHGSNMQRSGVPDCLVFLAHGITALIELKAPGEVASPMQQVNIDKLLALDHLVVVLDDIDEVISFVQGCERYRAIPIVDE